MRKERHMSQSNALRRSEAHAAPRYAFVPAPQDFSIRPLADAMGAEVVGIDLSRELDAAGTTDAAWRPSCSNGRKRTRPFPC
jgi:hypothetical protein